MNGGEICSDPHIAERGALTEVDGLTMQALIAQLSRTPGAVRWTGRDLGADNPKTPDPASRWFSDS